MTDSYITIASTAEAESVVKRSRFLARLERVEDVASALAVVEAARKRHWDARHHSFAFVLGPDGKEYRSSDDGEPSGTAGVPILEILRGRMLLDVAAVVTRWFGGTLLGTGGLKRAYSEVVRAALDAAGVRERRLLQRVIVDAAHQDAGRLVHGFRARGFHIAQVSYADTATVVLDVTASQRDTLDRLAAELSGCRVIEGPWHWVDVATQTGRAHPEPPAGL